MNRVNNKQSRPNLPEGEPIDALLGAFFRSEMPSPWPAFRPAARTRLSPGPVPVPRRSAYAGKFALAASVALLVVGTWLLPATFAPAPRGQSLPIIGPPSASKGGLTPIHLQPAQPGTPAPDKTKSSLLLEQGSDGRTQLKITVEELPSP